MAEKIEDFLVWQKATAFWDGVEAVLNRSAFAKDFGLHDQVRDAVDSITSNIEEGFEQSTDRHFAKFLYTSKGSAAEVKGRLRLACKRKYIAEPEYQAFARQVHEIQRMLSGLITYLLRSDRKDRNAGISVEPRREKRPRRPPRMADLRDTTSD